MDTRVTVALQIGDDAITNGSATTNLEVARFTAASGNKYNAFKIADKLGLASVVGIPAGSGTDVKVNATRDALRTSLIAVNGTVTGLDQAEANKITFTGSTLTANETNNSVTATITDDTSGAGAVTTTVILTKVQIHSTASEIAAKITSPTTTVVGIPTGSKTSLSDSATQTALKKAIQAQYSLSAHDISTITFPDASTTTLKDNEQDTAVKLLITDDSSGAATANVTLDKVQIHRTAAQIQTKIKAITGQNVKLTGSGGTTGTTSGLDAAIKTQLKADASLSS